jgi:hypothetical protein
MDDKHAEGVKQSIDSIIGSDTFLKQKRKTEDDHQRERFEEIIRLLEEVEVRSLILGSDLKLDFTDYDEKFYKIIDGLLNLHFGKEANEVIFFYLYDRMNPDGTVNELRDENDTTVPLNSPSDLWNVIKLIQSKVKRKNARL